MPSAVQLSPYRLLFVFLLEAVRFLSYFVFDFVLARSPRCACRLVYHISGRSGHRGISNLFLMVVN